MSAATPAIGVAPTPAKSRTALVVAGVIVVATVGAAYFGAVTSDVPGPGGESALGWLIFLPSLIFVACGALVAWHRPDHPVGWMFLAQAAAWTTWSFAGLWRAYALVGHPGTVPGGRWAAWVWDWGYVGCVVLLMATLLVLPDGRLPGTVARWSARALTVGMGFLLVGELTSGGPLDQTPDVARPTAVAVPSVLSAVVGGAAALLLVAGSVGAVVTLVRRYVRARGAEKLQLRWLLLAGILVVAAQILASVLEALGSTLDLGTLRLAPLALLPVAAAGAVLRYRLFDIDMVISRTLAYAALVVVISALYVGMVVALGAITGAADRTSLWPTLLATAVAAVVVQPLRARLLRLADRVVFGRRASPYEVLATLAERMAGSYPVGDVLHDIARAVADGTAARAVSVWTRRGGDLVMATRWPAVDGAAPPEPSTPVAHLDDIGVLAGASEVLPVRHDGALLGAIAVTLAAGESLAPPEVALLERVAAAAGLVMANVVLIDDLRASRQRLVSAADHERRRLERDLHDGAQQQLVTLALTLRRLTQETPADSPARAVAERAADELRTALAELRELARGIHPAVLASDGIVPAVRSIADRCPIPTTVTAPTIRRLPERVEITAYFVVAEALTNAVKHSSATRVTVNVGLEGGWLTVAVSDNGCGGALPSDGSGLAGLADRAAALGGSLTLHDTDPHGTVVTVRLPT